MGETASEFSTVREVSATKLLPPCTLPLIWFWLETVITRPSSGTTSQPPASSQAGSLELWFSSLQPTPKPWRSSRGLSPGTELVAVLHTAGETETQDPGKRRHLGRRP